MVYFENFRLPEERDEDYEKFKQESVGTGIVMSFDDEQSKNNQKPPMLSSMKRKNSEPVKNNGKKKKRSQWKKDSRYEEIMLSIDNIGPMLIIVHVISILHSKDVILNPRGLKLKKSDKI